MPLISSSRWKAGDREAWDLASRADAVWADTKAFWQKVKIASDMVGRFVAAGPCVAEISWGKDSVCLAHLVRRVAPEIPLVWVRVEPDVNPDCDTVKDHFMAMHPGPYDEIVLRRVIENGERAVGFLKGGVQEIASRYGPRHLYGLRAEESGGRKAFARIYGGSTTNACAPLIHWRCRDVFAYLAFHDLPTHPAYAMSYGGRLNRCDIRVSNIGGDPGRSFGRHLWERDYYPDVVSLAEKMGRQFDF